MSKPLVFFVPSEELKPAFFAPIVEALRQAGFLTSSIPAESSSSQMTQQQALMHYSKCLDQKYEGQEVWRDHVVLFGVGKGADRAAREFYSFYSVQMPRAMVLLSPTVQALQLNQITCPYLIVQGATDAETEARQAEAVHHHEMRYGDTTSVSKLPNLSKDFARNSEGEATISSEALTQIVDWLKVAVSEGLRPQERAGGSAVA